MAQFSIREHSLFRLFWDSLIIVAIVISGMLIAYHLALFQQPSASYDALIVFLNACFFVDMALNFYTSYRRAGVEIANTRETARHYLRTMFPVDFVANFPFELIALLILDGAAVEVTTTLAMLRILRVVRFFYIFHRWESYAWANRGFLRIGKFVVFIALVSHWLACLWAAIGFRGAASGAGWLNSAGIQGAEATVQYIRALYWTITTMTTVGYGDITPEGNTEYLFASLVMLIGASLYAYVIGNIASLLSSLNAAKSEHRERLQTLTEFLHRKRVPSELNTRIRNYYEHIWYKHRGFNEDKLLKELPQSLQIEIKMHLAREILENVPFFIYCSDIMRKQLLSAMSLETHDPGSLIVEEGELGDDIYFIVEGELTVVGVDDKKSYPKLGPGDYFGYLSIVLKERRTASVRAETYCDLMRLHGKDYDTIKEAYPEIKEVLKQAASANTEKMSELILLGAVL